MLPLQMDQFRMVTTVLLHLNETSRILETKNYIQHGTTSVYDHCRNVALVSLNIARKFGIKVDELSLVRGCLLHDYFLYDWHDKKARPHLHGFVHPFISLKNALEVYDLNDIEIDVIKNHMFPLTVMFPKTKEGWIITVADKICGLYETFMFNERHINNRKRLVLAADIKKI